MDCYNSADKQVTAFYCMSFSNKLSKGAEYCENKNTY